MACAVANDFFFIFWVPIQLLFASVICRKFAMDLISSKFSATNTVFSCSAHS